MTWELTGPKRHRSVEWAGGAGMAQRQTATRPGETETGSAHRATVFWCASLHQASREARASRERTRCGRHKASAVRGG